MVIRVTGSPGSATPGSVTSGMSLGMPGASLGQRGMIYAPPIPLVMGSASYRDEQSALSVLEWDPW